MQTSLPARLTLATFVFVVLVVEMEKEVMLPALPDVLTSLKLTYSMTQAILYVNFAGFCGSCLFASYLAKKLGYRWLILSMCLLFLMGSLMTCHFTSIASIISGRFVQGLAGSLLTIALFALIGRIYRGEAAMRTLGYVNGITCFVTAGAPLIGAVLAEQWGWQACFLSVAILSALGLVAMLTTLLRDKAVVFDQPEASLIAMPIAQSYRKLLADRTFLRYALIPAFMCASYMVYLSFLPFLVMQLLGLGRFYYSICQAGVLIAFSVPCFFAGKICAQLGARRIEKAASLASGALGLIYAAYLSTGRFEITTLGTLAILLFAAQGVPYSNYISYSIERAPGYETLASAFGMFLRFACSAIGIWLSSSLSANYPRNVSIVLAVLSVATLLIYKDRAAEASSTARTGEASASANFKGKAINS